MNKPRIELVAFLKEMRLERQIGEAHLQRAHGKDPSGMPKWLLNQMEGQMVMVQAAFCIDEKRFPAALEALDRALVLDRRPERHGRFFLSQ